MPTILDVLISALNLIRNPEQWCRGQLAQDAQGNPVEIFDPRAIRFDMLGALERVTNRNPRILIPAQRVLAAAANVRRENITRINDAATHIEILSIWAKGLQMAAEGRFTHHGHMVHS